MVFAGIKSVWRSPNGPVGTMAILTRAATAEWDWLQARMLLVLDPATARSWFADDPSVWAK